jgi:death on curing protein
VQSLVKNHGFVDANKRTAFLVVDLFLERSGYALHGVSESPDEELEQLILDIATNTIQLPAIETWFQKRLNKL